MMGDGKCSVSLIVQEGMYPYQSRPDKPRENSKMARRGGYRQEPNTVQFIN